jgi:hypothetical protein
MNLLLLAAFAAHFALEAAPVYPPGPAAPPESARSEPARSGTARSEPATQSAPPITSFSQLPIMDAAAPRCGVAFAVIGRWQQTDDPRGAGFPDMEAIGGREFFVQAMAGLMDRRALDREALIALVKREVETLDGEDTGAGTGAVEAMMPACLMMKDAAGL